ncbi:hypothetical protein BJ508DRAFT_309533 [Ascobolus immersus RN42]|uniref:Uncharacterized protein n=1 Tax=Ascobolus immersus RN42 TaxID=1160509 RepID=A0A3N4I1Q6_ASCIM|nr:hypothetical protein BJ508DRAFT_309533 [Ascobolus immersus RN42]
MKPPDNMELNEYGYEVVYGHESLYGSGSLYDTMDDHAHGPSYAPSSARSHGSSHAFSHASFHASLYTSCYVAAPANGLPQALAYPHSTGLVHAPAHTAGKHTSGPVNAPAAGNYTSVPVPVHQVQAETATPTRNVSAALNPAVPARLRADYLIPMALQSSGFPGSKHRERLLAVLESARAEAQSEEAAMAEAAPVAAQIYPQLLVMNSAEDLAYWQGPAGEPLVHSRKRSHIRTDRFRAASNETGAAGNGEEDNGFEASDGYFDSENDKDEEEAKGGKREKMHGEAGQTFLDTYKEPLANVFGPVISSSRQRTAGEYEGYMIQIKKCVYLQHVPGSDSARKVYDLKNAGGLDKKRSFYVKFTGEEVLVLEAVAKEYKADNDLVPYGVNEWRTVSEKSLKRAQKRAYKQGGRYGELDRQLDINMIALYKKARRREHLSEEELAVLEYGRVVRKAIGAKSIREMKDGLSEDVQIKKQPLLNISRKEKAEYVPAALMEPPEARRDALRTC